MVDFLYTTLYTFYMNNLNSAPEQNVHIDVTETTTITRRLDQIVQEGREMEVKLDELFAGEKTPENLGKIRALETMLNDLTEEKLRLRKELDQKYSVNNTVFDSLYANGDPEKRGNQ